MSARSLEVLKRVFGFDRFRPHQEEIVDHIVAGGDGFVLMPTGGGKSLCYQIPALLRPGVAIIVSPLISLMKDQVDALREAGVRAAYYNSSLGADEARRVLARLHGGELDLLYAAPEWLMTPATQARLREIASAGGASSRDGARTGGAGPSSGIALFAIDEAHCVSQWGHDFRPEYVQLGELRDLFPDVPLMACTATADPQTRADVRTRLGLDEAPVFVTGFDRPNIRYTVVDKRKPSDQLLAFLRERPDEAGIVYCLSRKRTEEVAGKLAAAGVPAAAYHAGLPAAERERVQSAFSADDLRVVVATVAFGLGIDKSNVRFVVHYDLPKNLESYYQETGRAGRDGLPAQALLLFGLGDAAVARSLIERSHNPEQIRIESHKLNSMVGFAEATTCRRRVLLGYLGEPLDHDCGNCDICLEPPETYNATEHAQMVLSTVARLNQRFGIGYVIDVLRGSENERILRFGHDQLSVYGIGADLTKDEWQGLIRQLIHRGYLMQDIARYSVLRLTERSRPLLAGDEELVLAKPRVKPPREARTRARKKPAARRGDERVTGGWTEGGEGGSGPPQTRSRASWGTEAFADDGGTDTLPFPDDSGTDDAAGAPACGRRARRATKPATFDEFDFDQALFDQLRTLRKQLANRRHVPAYVVFSDATLREMAARRPTTDDDLLSVSGVGETKLEKYGGDFLKIIRAFD